MCVPFCGIFGDIEGPPGSGMCSCGDKLIAVHLFLCVETCIGGMISPDGRFCLEECEPHWGSNATHCYCTENQIPVPAE